MSKPGRFGRENYVRGSLYIDGLGSMMHYYGLRACHFVILQYVGGSDFNVKFYNPYDVEMKYETEIGVSVVDDLSSTIEEDRLCSTFLYNAFYNFLGLYNMHIESKHLLVQNDMKVISEYGCYRFRLNDSVRSISKNWSVFVKAANIVVGDVVAFYKTDTPFKFKVTIFYRKTSSEQPLLGGHVWSSYANFFKVINFDSLEDGELFVVSVYDCQHMNHLRNIIGDFRFEDFMYPPCDTEVIVVSDNDENQFEDFSYSSSDSSSDSSLSTTSNIEQDNEEIVANQGMTFNVKLMKSHVD
ncbi:hypothetical protein POM88_019745 [Heracleum sosnowskyi]|uniref:TF-B3 domain-containing protein n=1 Tax=Heracleum sosnowskyi TaxID=360622 RepID=A0AAD8IAQ2_9APIA|nr:hypothetical protein POM88_019745 [Heracleum sosnowskyi]